MYRTVSGQQTAVASSTAPLDSGGDVLNSQTVLDAGSTDYTSSTTSDSPSWLIWPLPDTPGWLDMPLSSEGIGMDIDPFSYWQPGLQTTMAQTEGGRDTREADSGVAFNESAINMTWLTERDIPEPRNIFQVNELALPSQLLSDIIQHQQHQGKKPSCLDVSIEQLSRLSTRLHHLHQSSQQLAECVESTSNSHSSHHCLQRHDHEPHFKVRSTALMDDAVFQLVASWLTDATPSLDSRRHAQRPRAGSGIGSKSSDNRCCSSQPGLGDVLLDTFSMSNEFLGILHALHCETRCLPSPPIPSPYNHLVDLEGPYVAPTSQYHHSVILPLIVACHTQVLSIYVAILTVLKHDATLPSPSSGLGAMDLHDTGSADIRLVTVVQLCSYLFKRQLKTVDRYLATQSSDNLLDSALQMYQDNGGPDGRTNGSTHSGERGKRTRQGLKSEVQNRLEWLRETLHL
ncbi:hypothetical protein FSARC_13762 [Fusarium sarcochroum]|uniref:Uncharacterized protein n=1 Tax=Fusarium sarcochroum TaxID=1208366 RepID=A0A8H4SZ64_9HYPO|nr:hypothetical protein FSARC_13762 [Fusarium sarcochroum]